MDPRQRNIPVPGLTSEQPTLISLGYALNKVSPPAYKSSNFMDKKSRNQKKFDETIVWRGWKHYADDEISKKFPGYISVTDQEMRNRHTKLSPSIINMGNHNELYNGFATKNQAPSLHKSLYKKKSDQDTSTCHRITSNFWDTFKDYCDLGTLHGLKYIGNVTLNYLQRGFWILSFLFAIMGASYFIWLLYAKYSTTPIIISRSSESVSIEQFPFPAVTVCNMNNAKKSVADDIMKGNDSLQKFYLDDICDFNNGTSIFGKQDQELSPDVIKDAGAWENIFQFLLNVSQSCPQMLHSCQWRGNVTSCNDVFNPVLTDEGLCCRFNSIPNILYESRVWDNLDVSYTSDYIDWNPEYKFRKDDSPNLLPWRAYGSGSNYGLTLTLDVASEEYFCSSTSSVGFKILLHSPVEMPQIAEYAFMLSPGKETRVIITPHITDADKAIIKIPVKIRRCYFLNEKKLKYYRIYTQRNCMLECEANFTLKYCSCLEYYMPVANNTRICGKDDDDCNKLAKTIMKNKLYEDDESRAALNITEIPSCKCYPGCNEINYSTEISQSLLYTTFEIPDHVYKNYDKNFESNMAIVHIFFIDTNYMKYTKNIIYGFAELLSNTGGLLGLFLGFSLLSVVEIFYFSVKLLIKIANIVTHRNDKTKINNQGLPDKRGTFYPFAQ